jgi:23S rRNA (pseudouridine1915-N3)-methyltransferase
MKIELWTIGKTVNPWVKEGVKQYAKRLGHYTGFTVVEILDVRNPGKIRQEQLKILEGELILKKLDPSDCLILLDEHGKQMDSENFATLLQSFMNQSVRKTIFIIGGAWGFSEPVHQRAARELSLSMMTFNHELVRVLFLEQLYRAFTIIKGEPYHHK